MSVWITIPTGHRTDMVADVVRTWRQLGVEEFKIAVYTWDDKTYDKLKDKVDWIERGGRKSFAILQNYMAANIPDKDWTGIICAADDLYPFINCQRLPIVVNQYQGRLLFVPDCVNDQQPCHPVITRKWYDINRSIFDEVYVHNFCDTDLFHRHNGAFLKTGDIMFNHKHPIVGGREKDYLDEIAQKAWAQDERYFKEKNNIG